MKQETEREKFEAWCVKRNPNATGLFERHGKIYLREAVRAAWEAWQAALEAKQAEPECLTCNGHGAVGNAINGDLCPDCTLPRMAREAKQAEVQMPRPIGVLHVFEPHEGSGVVCAEASTNADHLPHGWHNLYTEQQVRAMLCCTAPARKPLTELEIDAAVYGLGHGQPTYRQVARAIEHAHGITGGKDGQQT